MNVDPSAGIHNLKGVGPKLEATLAKLGIFRLLDLLLHLPSRYQDRSKITPIARIRAGEECLIEGEVITCQVQFGKRRSLKVTLRDASGEVHLRFFHFSRYQQKTLEQAPSLRVYGEFRFFGRELTTVHPDYEVFSESPPPLSQTLTPIYPTTAGLGQGRLRNLQVSLCRLAWPDIAGTPFSKLKFLHQPPAGTALHEIEAIREDIAFDELCAYYLVMKGRALQRQQQSARALGQAGGLGRELLNNLGFHLTRAQAKVVKEVLTDLDKPVPMLRLVQGDVGSGKTVIAAFAAIRAAEHNCQTALMAPTELLAEQHYLNFSAWLSPLNISVVLLTGQLPAKIQKERLAAIESGDAQVVIGTHALFQQAVSFNRLALSIIDEQHRFGVHQRMALQNKALNGSQPHQLVMTATPIPRTLTMTLYADMDVSVIDELPKGRQPITTHTVEAGKRGQVVEQVAAALKQGQQAYWVCTLIEDSEELDAMSAEHMYQALSQALPAFRVGLLHGRMKSDEKVAVMNAFKAHQLDLLVATTVVEVGVDVPNATLMVMEDADRLGLAQLHQLRGRVGRGSLASHCYLLFGKGLSKAARTRLNAMRESQDGFYLAEQDLKLRGPGDILGTRQAGDESFRVADLGLHAHLMPRVMRTCDALLKAPPGSADAQKMTQLLAAWAPADSGHLNV
ncbi:MAG: ATP-dependent DNA helicase RecG [bacterium]